MAMAIQTKAHGALSMVFAVLVSTAAVKAQRDACGADLSTFLPSSFSSSRLHCTPVWNNFILRVPFPFLPSIWIVSCIYKRISKS
jgi:hypothetical protein